MTAGDAVAALAPPPSQAIAPAEELGVLVGWATVLFVAAEEGRIPAIALAACCAALATSTSARGDIYQHTDANGVVHFTNMKPASSGYKVVIHGERARRADGYGPGGLSGVGVPPSDKDVARFTRYDDYIRQASALYQIPEQLVRAVIKVESDYDPRAVSVSGARGLMQLMPDTAARLEVRDIDDPRENIFGGVRSPVVDVDFAPYFATARAILDRAPRPEVHPAERAGQRVFVTFWVTGGAPVHGTGLGKTLLDSVVAASEDAAGSAGSASASQ